MILALIITGSILAYIWGAALFYVANRINDARREALGKKAMFDYTLLDSSVTSMPVQLAAGFWPIALVAYLVFYVAFLPVWALRRVTDFDVLGERLAQKRPKPLPTVEQHSDGGPYR